MALINTTTTGVLGTTIFGDGTGTLTVQENGVTINQISSTGLLNGRLTSMTAQASTSGTSIDFTGIPSWVKRITVMFKGVSTSGTSFILIRLGYSGGIETTGYLSVGSTIAVASAGSTAQTTGFIVGDSTSAAAVLSGLFTFTLMDSATNTWVGQGAAADSANTYQRLLAGQKPISGGILDRIRITTVNGTDTFDAGSVNVLYE